jgi:hypothetical protein
LHNRALHTVPALRIISIPFKHVNRFVLQHSPFASLPGKAFCCFIGVSVELMDPTALNDVGRRLFDLHGRHGTLNIVATRLKTTLP